MILKMTVFLFYCYSYDSTGNSPKLSHPWKQSVEHSLPLDTSLNRSLIVSSVI